MTTDSPLARVLADTRRLAGDLPPAWAEAVVPALADAAVAQRRLAPAELERFREVGAQAARAGVELASLVTLHLRAARLVWDSLDGLAAAAGRPAPDRAPAGAAALQASDEALAAVAAGFGEARRLLARQEEAVRRAFLDDLLDGRGDLGELAERAEHVGLHLAAVHVVAVVEASAPGADAGPLLGRLEGRVRAAFPGREVLVATRDGLGVCVLADSERWAAREGGRSASALARVLRDPAPTAAADGGGGPPGWRVGIGRARAGPGGVARSYRDGREALDLARRLGLPDPVVLADQLLVYRVLLRDQAAMAELVTAVLSPLTGARGGAVPLLDTLAAYFASGCVATEAARRLHLSVRAVTYRLDRVCELTGHDPTRVEDRLTLEVAVTGARLLGWPGRRLPSG